MHSTEILLPAFAMFFLTIGCIFYLGFSRYRAIHAKQVKVSFYRTYDEGSQPKRLHLLSRHVQNHFEVPPIFYAAVLVAYTTHNETIISLVFAFYAYLGFGVRTYMYSYDFINSGVASAAP